MNLAAFLAALHHPAARRRFTAVAGGPAGPGWTTVAAASLDDPVSALGIAELTGTMAFHGLAVPLVDLVTSLYVTAGVGVELDAERVWVLGTGPAITDVAVDVGLPLGPADATQVAAGLVDHLDPLVDEPVRWGAVADLVAVIALARSRAHGLDPERTWELADAVVAALRSARPHPDDRPEPLAVPGPGGGRLTLARRSTCCQWYRAARQLADSTGAQPSVTDARCADCPGLDLATNVSRLAALAASHDLADP